MKSSIRVFFISLLFVLFVPSILSAQWIQTNGTFNDDVSAFAVRGTNLYAGTWATVFLSTDGGNSWSGSSSGLGRNFISAIVSAPNGTGGFYLLASANGRIYTSSNSGSTWDALNSNIPSTDVGPVIFIGTNLYAGTIFDGVCRLSNNGTNWTSVNLGMLNSLITKFAVINNNIFAGTAVDGIYRTTNNGTNWTPVNSGFTKAKVTALVVSATTLFVGSDYDGVFRSTDNGNSWTAVNSGLTDLRINDLAVSGTNIFAAPVSGGIFLSTNSGANWTPVNTGFAGGALRLAVNETYLFAGKSAGGGIWRRPLSEMTTGTTPPTSPVLLTANVDTVWCNGTIGQMIATSSVTFSVAAANELTASAPSSAILASVVGSGRAVGYSHDGFVTDANIQRYDNLAMAVNAIKWLDVNNKKSLLIASGHGEFTNLSNTSVLKTQLQQLGYSVNTAAGSLTSTTISNYGVVMIGNAWGAITQAELDSLSHYVQRGGGLLMLGLGWSYLSYNAGKTLDDYPMNKVGDLCGMRWTGGTISDPSHSVSGAPLFLTFYPNIRTQGFTAATAFIDSVTRAKNSALPSTLQSDAITRTLYVNAHLYIRSLTSGLADTS